jgi:ribosomal protein S27E
MLLAGAEVCLGAGVRVYVRHRPERTLLDQIIGEYYPAFKQHLDTQKAYLPRYVEQEFEDYLKCGRLEHGFLCVRCDNCHAEHLVAVSCKRRGFCPSCGARGMAESAALPGKRHATVHRPCRLRMRLDSPLPKLSRIDNNLADGIRDVTDKAGCTEAPVE